MTEQAREKFAMMMADFREQGTPDEEIKKMITPEGFTKYVQMPCVCCARIRALGWARVGYGFTKYVPTCW